MAQLSHDGPLSGLRRFSWILSTLLNCWDNLNRILLKWKDKLKRG